LIETQNQAVYSLCSLNVALSLMVKGRQSKCYKMLLYKITQLFPL